MRYSLGGREVYASLVTHLSILQGYVLESRVTRPALARVPRTFVPEAEMCIFPPCSLVSLVHVFFFPLPTFVV